MTVHIAGSRGVLVWLGRRTEGGKGGEGGMGWGGMRRGTGDERGLGDVWKKESRIEVEKCAEMQEWIRKEEEKGCMKWEKSRSLLRKISK